ncbi:MAG TPA: hypothetical protein VFL29_14935 [Candidatus Dormibacteraeota bacterium]|nr:hypothetical protein [Candidatus Dormibacteraeota bacterium]
MNRKRLLQYGAIGAGAVIVLAVAVAAFTSLKVPFEVPTAQPSTGPCDPAPCANVRGYFLWVSDFKVSDGLVMMQLKFRNSSSSTHAAPEDFSLLDSQKADVRPVYSPPGCMQWPRTEFNDGASFGPVPMCFRPTTTSPPLGLRWTPDFGPFCCETVIALE